MDDPMPNEQYNVRMVIELSIYEKSALHSLIWQNRISIPFFLILIDITLFACFFNRMGDILYAVIDT